MSAEHPIPKEDVTVLLARSLGQEKSNEVVSSAARALGITRSSFSSEEVDALFDHLVKAEGLVGVVARFAVSRGDVDKLVARSSAPPDEPAKQASFRVDLLPLLAPGLGAEKAQAAMEAAAARCNVDHAGGLSQWQALAVLDDMAHVDGIVGVVARFAKARFLLR